MIEIKNLTIVIFVMILSILLAIASFGAGSPEAYLFPRIITSIMLLLSLLLLVFHFYEKNYQIETINISKLSPILILIIFFIFTGEYLGFYFSTSIIFLTSVTTSGPTPSPGNNKIFLFLTLIILIYPRLIFFKLTFIERYFF